MRTLKFFITGILCLAFSIQLIVAQSLDTKISIRVKDATLPQVLQQIQKKYGYRFSYLNNELPAKQRFSAEIKNKPFAEVLDVLLEKTDLGYKQSNGQIILKKGFPKSKPKTTTFQKITPPAPEKTLAKTPAKPAETKTPKTEASKPQPVAAAGEAPNRQPEIIAEKPGPAPVQTAAVGEVRNAFPADENVRDTLTVFKMEGRKETIFDKLAALRLKNEKQAEKSDSTLINSFHLGFTYPLSTNGTQAYKYVNRISAHALVGTSAGLEGLELAGFGNVEKSYVSGVQFAGFFNIARNSAELTTLAQNRNQGYTLDGAQFAGFFNLANGNAKGAQLAGYMNIAAGHMNGAQLAGFLNIGKQVNGLQAAGYMNLAKNVEGAQLAGFLNIADTVAGVQASGFLNVAKTVYGPQIAVINVADSVTGVPIGLFTFVRKGGYKHAEFYVADDFDANFAFKLGVPRLHTFVALGAEVDGEKRWGYGFGIGSEWNTSRFFKINTDLMAYQVIEASYEKFPDEFLESDYLNLLSKFRLLGTLQLARHFSLFAGPTLNVAVSQYQAPGSDEVGSTLPNKTFYDRTFNQETNVKIGFGFNAGLRF